MHPSRIRFISGVASLVLAVTALVIVNGAFVASPQTPVFYNQLIILSVALNLLVILVWTGLGEVGGLTLSVSVLGFFYIFFFLPYGI
ncbi:MAG: hypothetical protein ABH885_05105, partial [Candidatus Omnitrophota bacterium]